MTFREAYREAVKRLRDAGIADADGDAWLLLEHVTGMDRARFYADGERSLPEEQWVAYDRLLGRRAERIPLQHLTGVQEFMGFSFRVDGRVLIPRQDTEILVEEAERFLREQAAQFADSRGNGPAEQGKAADGLCQAGNGRGEEIALRALDLCTGSGCIAISLKKRNPWLCCEASDISPGALELARENAGRLEAEVAFLESDLFAGIPGTYDLIMSNPPYIPSAVIGELEPEVREHDPRAALDGGADGLDFYRRLAKQAPDHLRPGGALLLEIGCDQAEAVEAFLLEQGFTRIRVKKDLAGLDRVVSAVYADI